jgi:peptidylprolyl isomerase
VFHSSVNHEPATFTLGGGEIISGVERAVPGMRPGERKTVTVPAAQAYRPYLDDKVVEVARDRIPRDIEPRVGQQYEVHVGDAPATTYRVTAVSATIVTLDANHPLAGKDLIFEIQLLEIGSQERSRA